ncbi:MAG: hypothetical protein WD039_01245 [Xanthobacteraceae bacterium]
MARGRRFGSENARSEPPKEADSEPSAGRHTQADARAAESLDLFLFDVADMAQAITRMKAEIAAIKPPPEQRAEIGEAAGELDSIVHTTENATSHILTAAERLQEIAWTLREKGIDENLCDQLDAQATEIYTACSFQDLTGQRTRKVIQVLRYLEYRINAMISIWSKNAQPSSENWGIPALADISPLSSDSLDQADVDVMMQPSAPPKEEIREHHPMEWGEAPLAQPAEEPPGEQPADFATANREEPQAEAPAAFEQEPREGRQDATLEDIERVMMALDPFLVVRPDAVSGEPPDAPKAAAEAAPASSFAEQQPELSTAAAVLKEEATIAIASRNEAGAPARNIAEPPTEPVKAENTPHTESEAAPREPVAEFGMSARATAVLLQVQAAAARPTAEDAWSVLERLALNLLPPQPDTAAARPQTEAYAAMPPADLDFGQAPANLADDGIGTPNAAISPEPESPSKPAAALEAEADDFLFAPEQAAPEAGPADFLLEPKPAPSAQVLPAIQLQGAGTSEPSRTATPARPAPAPFAARPAAKPAAHTGYDPLAPLRALSDEEKVALFS